MKDIRRHGQEALLTLTVDCALSDEELRQVARELKPFGRMIIRINHECCGSWFTHNKRFSFAQIGAFFCRFREILREEAPNIRVIFCGGWGKADGTIEQEDAFRDCYKAADFWSCDCYLALHWGWPNDVAEVGGGSYKAETVQQNIDRYLWTYRRARELAGEDKPMISGEFNADGDVTGPRMQGDGVVRFCKYIKENRLDWFKAISMYQFRDRGRLGLEIEDPNNDAVGIEQPLLRQYRDQVLHDPYFMPEMTEGGEAAFPVQLRWGSSEDADGLSLPIAFEGNPEFCELTLEDPVGLMVELNGRWFYKAPHVKTIDLMSAFFDKPLEGPQTLTLKLFAPPADGVNVDDGSEDWLYNYRVTLAHAPEMRIRYQVPGVVG
jgi:hypothetical protein